MNLFDYYALNRSAMRQVLHLEGPALPHWWPTRTTTLALTQQRLHHSILIPDLALCDSGSAVPDLRISWNASTVQGCVQLQALFRRRCNTPDFLSVHRTFWGSFQADSLLSSRRARLRRTPLRVRFFVPGKSARRDNIPAHGR